MVEMTPAQQEAIWRKPPPPQDKRPWWKRLLTSIRPDVRFSPSAKRPVKYVGIKGKVEF
jgi:hypothetical protein